MSPFRYPATVKVDTAGFYLVTFPDVPEAGTDANTREEALREAVDALIAETAFISTETFTQKAFKHWMEHRPMAGSNRYELVDGRIVTTPRQARK